MNIPFVFLQTNNIIDRGIYIKRFSISVLLHKSLKIVLLIESRIMIDKAKDT